MNISKLLSEPGIYQIVNTITGKCYVGSSVNVAKRLRDHVRDLQGGKHHSFRLQKSWDKHGPGAFDVRVLETVVGTSQLLEREQYWLDVLQPFKNGYNVAIDARSTLGMSYTPEMLQSAYGDYQGYAGFIDPDGREVETIINLEQFCKKNGLISSNMHKVYRGAKPSHRGWTHVDSVNKRNHPKHWSEYPGWISPEGEEITIVNLRAFCADHNLDQSSMWRVMQGKYPQHKGWRYPAGGYVPKQRETTTWYGYVSPEGKQVVIDNLFQFSQERGLSEAHMGRLRTGERKTHKGWTYNPALERKD